MTLSTERIAHLISRLYGEPPPLGARERVAALLLDLDQQIHLSNSFDGFFAGEAGDRFEETVQALEAVEAGTAARVLREAAAAFPGGVPAADFELRQAQLEDGGRELQQRLAELVASYDEVAAETEAALERWMTA